MPCRTHVKRVEFTVSSEDVELAGVVPGDLDLEHLSERQEDVSFIQVLHSSLLYTVRCHISTRIRSG